MDRFRQTCWEMKRVCLEQQIRNVLLLPSCSTLDGSCVETEVKHLSKRKLHPERILTRSVVVDGFTVVTVK